MKITEYLRKTTKRELLEALGNWLDTQKELEEMGLDELTDERFEIILSDETYMYLSDYDEIPRFNKRKIKAIRWYNPEEILEYGNFEGGK